MVINILAFGVVKEIVGGSSVSMNFTDAITVAELVSTVKEKYPEVTKLSSFAVAVNGSYATLDTVIKQSDEIAIIPPVSGG